MTFRALTKSCALILVMSLGLAPVAQSRELYRYYNADGNMVVDYQVPAEYIAGGYEVLNDEGVVIKLIPAVLTEE